MTFEKLPIHALIVALFLSTLVAPPAHAASKGQTIYVPAYSHIYSGDMAKPFYLAVTLSIRNTDPQNALTLTRVDYHDSNGKRLTRHLEAPVTLAPLSATRYIVKESDKAGGSGAHFLVTWRANGEISPPITESIMIGTRAQQGISFTSRGQVISEQP